MELSFHNKKFKKLTNQIFLNEIWKKVGSLLIIGLALDSLEKQKEALTLNDEVLNADPKNLEAYIIKGEALLKLKMY